MIDTLIIVSAGFVVAYVIARVFPRIMTWIFGSIPIYFPSTLTEVNP